MTPRHSACVTACADRSTARLKQEQLTRWGFTPGDVLEAIQTAYDGVAVSQVYVGNQVYDVNVSLEPAARRNLAAIGSLLLRSLAGVTVPLRQLADISQTTSRYQILHSDGQRLQTVTSAVRGRTVSEFVNEAQQRVDKEVSLPKGTYL